MRLVSVSDGSTGPACRPHADYTLPCTLYSISKNRANTLHDPPLPPSSLTAASSYRITTSHFLPGPLWSAPTTAPTGGLLLRCSQYLRFSYPIPSPSAPGPVFRVYVQGQGRVTAAHVTHALHPHCLLLHEWKETLTA